MPVIGPNGVQWPTNCDYRPAWWGVGATFNNSPMPSKLEALINNFQFSEPDFPLIPWWPWGIENPLGINYGFEANPDDFVDTRSGYTVMGDPDVVLVMRYIDKQWTGPGMVGNGWARSFTGRIEHPATGEFIQMDFDPKLDSDPAFLPNWRRGEIQYWPTNDVAFGEVLGWAVDWNIDGWVSPIGRQPEDNPLMGVGASASRPYTWEGPDNL